jgi:hypothetical protein
MHTQEIYIDADRHVRLGDSGIQEAFTDTPGALFRALRAEYGRCTGKVRIDTLSQGTVAIGWVFEKRVRYRGCSPDIYTQEVWVTLFEPCELDDPLALRRVTPLGEETIRFRYHRMPA